MSTDTTTKDCIVHSQPKAVPIIRDSSDELKATDIALWEYSALNYKSANADKVSDTTIIPMLATGFQDELVRDWFDVNHDDFVSLSITNFTNSMRTNFLDEHWARDLHSSILSSAQSSNKSISQWSSCLWKKATLLNKMSYQISDECLLDHFETNLAPHLLSAYRNDEEIKKVQDLNNIQKWTSAAVRFENRTKDCLREWEDMVKKHPASNSQPNSNAKHQNTGYCSNATISVPSTASTSTASTSAASGSGSNPPSRPGTPGIGGLNDPMREYLDKHKGCRKCQRTNTDHCSADCTLGFPDPATYRGITLADGVTLALDTPSLNSVTSITVNDTSHISSGPIAVISSSLPVPSHPPTNELCIIIDDDNLSVDSDNEAVHSANCSTSLPPHFGKVHPICSVSSSPKVPFALDHLVWPCAIEDRSSSSPFPSYVHTCALIDDGSHLVLIKLELIACLNLKVRPLPKPISVTIAFQDNSTAKTSLISWVKLKLHARKNQWSSGTVCTIIAPNLCTDIILGLPFLAANKLIIDPSEHAIFDKTTGFDLLHPTTPVKSSLLPQPSAHSAHIAARNDLATTNTCLPFHALTATDTAYTVLDDPSYNKLRDSDPICAVCKRIEQLEFQERLSGLGAGIEEDYKDVFEPLAHIDDMPSEVKCSIKLKDTNKSIAARSYTCPRKYRDAWQSLIKHHLDAGQI